MRWRTNVERLNDDQSAAWFILRAAIDDALLANQPSPPPQPNPPSPRTAPLPTPWPTRAAFDDDADCDAPAAAPAQRHATSSGDTHATDDVCPICHDVLLSDCNRDGRLGTLDCCEHRFCFDCIRTWTTTSAATCPMCTRTASAVTRCSESGDAPLETVQLSGADNRPRGYLDPNDMPMEIDVLERCAVCAQRPPHERRACAAPE